MRVSEYCEMRLNSSLNFITNTRKNLPTKLALMENSFFFPPKIYDDTKIYSISVV